MQQSSATPKNQDVGRGCGLLHALNPPHSAFFGTVSSLHPTSCFTHFFSHKYGQDTVGSLASLVYTVRDRYNYYRYAVYYSAWARALHNAGGSRIYRINDLGGDVLLRMRHMHKMATKTSGNAGRALSFAL